MARSVELKNGEKKIGLNPFSKQIIENVIIGIVKALKGIDMEDEIVITLGKKAD